MSDIAPVRDGMMQINQTNVNQGDVNNVVEKTGTSYKGYRPRHDYVLLRLTDGGKSEGGLALPEGTREGVRWHVLAIGPEVKDLKVGDRIEPFGEIGQDIARVPQQRDGLFIMKETNIPMVLGNG